MAGGAGAAHEPYQLRTRCCSLRAAWVEVKEEEEEESEEAGGTEGDGATEDLAMAEEGEETESEEEGARGALSCCREGCGVGVERAWLARLGLFHLAACCSHLSCLPTSPLPPAEETPRRKGKKRGRAAAKPAAKPAPKPAKPAAKPAGRGAKAKADAAAAAAAAAAAGEEEEEEEKHSGEAGGDEAEAEGEAGAGGEARKRVGRPVSYKGDPDAPHLTDAERRKIKR